MRDLLNDSRYALRSLRTRPGFAAVVVATLALGIGATSAIFSVVDGVLLKPLPYPEPDRLVQIWDATGRFGLTEPEFVAFRDRPGPLESLAVSVSWRVDLTGDGVDPERLAMAFVSSEFLSTLRVWPDAGRDFTPQDMDPNAELVTILADGLWRGRFGADPSVIGRSITLNGQAVRVVGVLPRGFEPPGWDAALLLPYSLNPSSLNTSDRFLLAVARLKEGVSPAEATQALGEMNERYRQRAERLYGRYNASEAFHAVPLREELVGGARRALWLLLAAAGFVLPIACGNIGGMLLVRAEGRTREMVIRRALGAGRGRLVRQLLSESLLLAALSGAAGLVLATWGTELLSTMAGASVPRLEEVSVDVRVLGFGIAVTLLVGLAVGVLPAFRLGGKELEAKLRSGGVRTGAGTGGGRLRRVLVVSEIALALVVVTGAALMAKSFWKLVRTDPGFVPENVLTFQVGLPVARYADTAAVIRFYRELPRRLRELDGVEAAGAISRLPLSESNPNSDFEIEGRPTAEDEIQVADYRIVTPGYFEALGIRRVAGRVLTLADDADAPPVAVISRSMARHYWSGAEALGRRIRVRHDLPWLTVIGVVDDVKKEDLRFDPGPMMYFPHAQMAVINGLGPTRSLSMAVRAERSPMSLAGQVRSVLAELDPLLPVTRLRTMEGVVHDSIADSRFSMLLLSGFAGLALLLSLIGVYGVLAYLVARRSREMGVRQALGATSGDLLRLVLKEGVRLGGLGLVTGLLLTLGLVHLATRQFYGVSPIDPAVYAGVSALLFIAVLAASWLPARRAARMDPMAVLREE